MCSSLISIVMKTNTEYPASQLIVSIKPHHMLEPLVREKSSSSSVPVQFDVSLKLAENAKVAA